MEKYTAIMLVWGTESDGQKVSHVEIRRLALAEGETMDAALDRDRGARVREIFGSEPGNNHLVNNKWWFVPVQILSGWPEPYGGSVNWPVPPIYSGIPLTVPLSVRIGG